MKIYIIKTDEQGYGYGVQPEMEMPDNYSGDCSCDDCYEWIKHIKSLPFTLVHPSFNCKQGDWIEQWREGWEVKVFLHPETVWEECNEETYSFTPDLSRRIVLLPKVEEMKEDDNPPSDLICPFCSQDNFDKIGLKYHLRNHCEEYDKT